MEKIESNHRVARRVYQHLYYDIAELFFEHFQSMSALEQQAIDKNMRINGWDQLKKFQR